MTTIKNVFLIIVVFCFSAGFLSAQEDLIQDKAFFKNQERIYQKWLNQAGLGKSLQVHSTTVKSDELILYLQFPFTDTDSVTNAWNQLKVEFESQSPLTLEQELFYKMTSLMEIRQSIGSIQLYDTYDMRIDYCFKRKIYARQGEVITEKESCKAQVRNIDFDATDFSKRKAPSVLQVGQSNTKKQLTPAEIQKLLPREVVFDLIYQYAKDYYEQTTCENRYPQVKLMNSKGILRFKVTDLCREVLKDENPKLCKILRFWGHQCNWIKRERLIFTFTYEETPKGFNLHCIIDGAYGSGYYSRVRRGGYHNMEVDFDDELEEYADVFKERIRSLLTQSQ